MADSLTFLHAADLHIGAPFRGLRALSDEWARRLIEAIPAAWDRVVELAVTRRVDFIVVSGDIFDSVRASYRDYLRFFEGLHRLDAEGIPSYLCTGNHDPLSLWQQDFFALPPSTTMLAADRPDFALFEKEGRPLTIIGGRGYPNKVWSPNENIAEGITRAAAIRALGPRAAEAPYAVGVLHTGLTLDPVKAPTNPVELLRAGFDYWALGHIHKRWVNDERVPRIVFSGCIQGRDVRETGPRGVNLVTLSVGRPPEIAFVPTASVVWEAVKVDASDCANIPALVAKTMRELFAVNGDASCEMMVSRITFVGATPLHEVLARPGVLEEVRESLNDSYSEFFCDGLFDATTAPIDEAALRAEGLFPAVFLRTADSFADDLPGQIDYLQEEYLARNVPLTSALSEKKARQLTEEATHLVLDLLLQGGDGR
ncbi:metallophosphoesterase family protein [Adlercreutzia shanghongiae]|uniref:DNA repair exonuclease n=1 Tax=Adlercreutzia shanghongiae TaxID=3111773 RepID=A0ABU6IVC6_9ACTN|nr:DNA repair exonuclease [Adlercreutzia sp. R22]MEC4293772.1 DNA repair exonuclease [Adlercreutzia sp. R22]